jgi:hypothetical protein
VPTRSPTKNPKTFLCRLEVIPLILGYQLLSGVRLSKRHFFDVFNQARNIEKNNFIPILTTAATLMVFRLNVLIVRFTQLI